jgi:hypothetical protein
VQRGAGRGGEDKVEQGESDRRCTVRSGGGKWTRRLEFLALGAPGVGVRAVNSLALCLFHEGDRGTLLSDTRKWEDDRLL